MRSGDGTACKAVEGASPRHLRLRLAHSTILRMVPLPRWGGMDCTTSVTVYGKPQIKRLRVEETWRTSGWPV
jgi:hypothetical protein